MIPGILLALFAYQPISIPPEWKEPVEPFRIIGSIHYVGTAELGSYLITTPEGHILLDSPCEGETPLLLESIRKLGFDPKEIRILLNSQAHFDHTGALRALKELSGARMMAGAKDAELLARGGRGDFAFGDRFLFPGVEVDRPLHDGDAIELGGVTLTVRLTPGHTRGTTTYVTEVEEGGRRYRVVIAGSLTVTDGVRLANPPSYEGIADDYARSIQILESLRPDVFLSAHGGFFRLGEKKKALAANGAASPNPFVESELYRRWLTSMKAAYEKRLAQDRGSK
ncbi:MAG: subclass B3 metallo-beta-lactamase [Vicinamibacteria bacterium]